MPGISNTRIWLDHSTRSQKTMTLFDQFTFGEPGATALGIFKEEFPTDQMMSDMVPFLGHVGLESMTCRRSDVEQDFVRVIANSATRPMPV